MASSKRACCSSYVGVTKIEQLEDAVKAVDVKLTQEEINYLEEPYTPHPIVGPLLPPK